LGFWAFGLDLGFSFFALPLQSFVGVLCLIKLAKVRSFVAQYCKINLWVAQHDRKMYIKICGLPGIIASFG
jgi:hypothetical protein